jgi:hypothetical protein
MSDEKFQILASSAFHVEIFIPRHIFFFQEADGVLFDIYTKDLLSGASLNQK